MTFKRLWNVGSKTADLSADIAFLTELGAVVLAHDTVVVEDHASDYAILAVAGTRVFLAPEPAFEQQIARALPTGLTHVVFEVDSIDEAMAEIHEAGGRTLISPTRVVGAFGDRTIAFAESPGGLIFEIAELHTSPLEGDAEDSRAALPEQEGAS